MLQNFTPSQGENIIGEQLQKMSYLLRRNCCTIVTASINDQIRQSVVNMVKMIALALRFMCI
jgi:hypothetical protein